MSRNKRRAHASRDPQLVAQIAQVAARLMAEDGIRDFAFAKRKAAEQLGIGGNGHLPSNIEVEQALIEYQRLFRADSQPEHLHHLREQALEAMRFFDRFSPRLVGPVLLGTADRNYPVQLHLFTDTLEELDWFLMDHKIPFQLGERRLRVHSDRTENYPVYELAAGDVALELTVFPYDGLRQAPLSPVDGRPMERAGTAAVEALLEETPAPH